MMRKTFGQFESPQEADPMGSQTKAPTPPIMGAPMPNAGMKNQNMGNVSPPKDKPSPKQFAQRQAAGKRLKQMPNQSPLGPITGGPAKPQARPQARPQMQQQQQEPVGTGDRWMGELWQGLTLDDQPQGSFAMGGRVGNTSSPEMDLYNKVTMELESGGVSGYAHGGMVEKSREIASKGRNGDTMLMHIQPQELEGLQSLLGPVTINPETGNPEAFAWFAALPLLGKLAVGALGGGALGAGIGGIAGGKEGALKGLAMGSMLGTGAAGLGAAAGVGAGAGASAVAPTTAVSTVGSSAAPTLTSAPLLTAPGSVTLPGGFTGIAGSTTITPAATAMPAMPGAMLGKGSTVATTLAPKTGLSAAAKEGFARAGASGLQSIMNQSKSQEQAPPPMPPAPAPSPRRLEGVESPYEKIKRRHLAGIGTLPGSGSVV